MGCINYRDEQLPVSPRSCMRCAKDWFFSGIDVPWLGTRQPCPVQYPCVLDQYNGAPV